MYKITKINNKNNTKNITLDKREEPPEEFLFEFIITILYN